MVSACFTARRRDPPFRRRLARKPLACTARESVRQKRCLGVLVRVGNGLAYPHLDRIGRELESELLATGKLGLQYSPLQERLARSLEWYGEWLQGQLDLLAKLLRPGAVVVEAGAGIGAHRTSIVSGPMPFPEAQRLHFWRYPRR